MGEKQDQPFQLSFNASLKVDFQGSRVTSDGGLILVRELDERLGLEKLIEEHLSDSRQGLNVGGQHDDAWSSSSLQRRLVKTGGRARPLLLGAAGGESPHAAVVWEHARQDRGAAITSRIDEP
jgi:hypothetical protein